MSEPNEDCPFVGKGLSCEHPEPGVHVPGRGDGVCPHCSGIIGGIHRPDCEYEKHSERIAERAAHRMGPEALECNASCAYPVAVREVVLQLDAEITDLHTRLSATEEERDAAVERANDYQRMLEEERATFRSEIADLIANAEKTASLLAHTRTHLDSLFESANAENAELGRTIESLRAQLSAQRFCEEDISFDARRVLDELQPLVLRIEREELETGRESTTDREAAARLFWGYRRAMFVAVRRALPPTDSDTSEP